MGCETLGYLAILPGCRYWARRYSYFRWRISRRDSLEELCSCGVCCHGFVGSPLFHGWRFIARQSFSSLGLRWRVMVAAMESRSGLGRNRRSFLAFSLIIILMSPFLVRKIYTGKLWGTQPWFFGFEGYMDLATIEAHIFGAYMSRLKWSPAGSPISAHVKNKFGECVGIDPTINPDVKALVEQAKTGRFGDLKVFTLVDTLTLTVTIFTAVRPPVAVLLCGHEGGMQRAVMASYDWKEQTLYREAVLRMETPVLEMMSRMHRFRFGFSRPMVDAQELQ